MGEVYLAEELSPLRLKVAVKLLPPAALEEERLRRLFRREARAMAALTHRGVPRVLEFGEAPVPFLVMELLVGATLREVMTRRGPLEPGLSAFLASEVARAVGAAHAVRDEDLPAGLVHGDLSPSNVMLCRDGAVKVLDFGLARPAHAERSVSTVEGKLAWLPPEALSGDIGQSADLYAIGVVLYELVTGRQPFAGKNDLETVRNVLEGQVVPVQRLAPEVPDALAAIITRAISRDVGARFQSGEALAEALDGIVSGQVSLADVQRLVESAGGEPSSLATPSAASPLERVTAEVPPPRAELPSVVIEGVPLTSWDDARPRSRWPWLVLAVAALVAASLTVRVMTSAPEPSPPAARSAPPPAPSEPPPGPPEPDPAPKPMTPTPTSVLQVTVNVDATIELDGVVVSRGARTARLPVSRDGAHRLSVSAAGYRSLQKLVVTSAGAELEVPVSLVRIGKRAGPASGPVDDSSPLDPFRAKP